MVWSSIMSDATKTPPPVDELDFPDRSHYGTKQIKIEELLLLRAKGLSHSQIARVVGCTPSNITKRLQLVDDPILIEDFKSARADVLAYQQRRVLNHITDDKLKAASAYQLVGMFSLLHERERLERGQSTQNIAALSQVISKVNSEPAPQDVVVPSKSEVDNSIDIPQVIDIKE